MKMNRRKAMGAMLGGAVAAPSIAKEVGNVKSYKTFTRTLPPFVENGFAEEAVAPDNSWHKLRLLRTALGVKSKAQRIREEYGMPKGYAEIRHQIEALRSVSTINKVRIINEMENELYETREKLDAAAELMAEYGIPISGMEAAYQALKHLERDAD